MEGVGGEATRVCCDAGCFSFTSIGWDQERPDNFRFQTAR